MRRLALLVPVLSVLFLAARVAQAACTIGGAPPQPNRDPLAVLLQGQDKCPLSAIDFRNLLERSGLRLETTEVDFLGFHNTNFGALFLFEIVSGKLPSIAIERGDLLFGFFLTSRGSLLTIDAENSLKVEAIAWDPAKQMFNFYELVSDGQTSWFYRGDSKLVLDDIQLLHRSQQAGQKPFRNQLRCSGCHVNGGLIQKELAQPHNDWWTAARNLPPGDLKPDQTVEKILKGRVDAEELGKLVRASSRRLAASPEYRKALLSRSMQEQLRPLFCPVELNIESDAAVFDDRKPTVQIPAAFFADPRLGASNIVVPRTNYDQALVQSKTKLSTKFSSRTDADHAWLTPVKANSDMALTEALVSAGVVDNEFVADVLAVDFTTPFFSRSRCGLLKLVPIEGGPTFQARFQTALNASPDPAAKALLANLTDPKRNAEFHRQQVKAFLDACAKRASTPAATNEWFGLLAQRRAEINRLEISKHPRGSILEPPSRVVFRHLHRRVGNCK